ncbi:MAG TPA: right-handed parallel beta-helix repeat-containing protein [Kofleriaceae bacterium]
MAFLWLATFGCSKQTPGLCCTDEADCAAAGLSGISSCDDGLACRGNQCIAEVCGRSSDCDAAAPYCMDQGANSGLCAGSCSDDAQCPGAAQTADDQFCVSGACAECRRNDDCSVEMPVCAAHSCRACVEHAECASHVCTSTGACATEDQIVHVAPSGADAGDCGQLAPCSLAYAIGHQTGRRYLLLSTGTYVNSATMTVPGKQVLIGDGAPRPTITNSGAGPIFSIGPSADVELDGIEVSGARGGAGAGIECDNAMTAGERTLRLIDDLITQNMVDGLHANRCVVTAIGTTFSLNGSDGIVLTDSRGTFDRCTFNGNTSYGIYGDGTLYDATNSFVYRNGTGVGVFSFPDEPGSLFAFNTVVDNGIGVDCQANAASPLTLSNNIIVRNSKNTDGQQTCSHPGSILAADVAPLHFVQPDVAPYDYHLTTGSSAIDQATASTIDHDFDGDGRPRGNGRDIGADEAQ